MQHILITGGEGGLAQAIAHAFRSIGDSVHAPGRTELDVTDAASVKSALAAHPLPDAVICNAGFADDQLLAHLDEAAFSRHLDVNLHGAFRCVRAVVPQMIRRGSGHLIFISSRSALHPPAGQAAYASAKAALIGFSHSLAQELGDHNIRSNVILPGFLDTPMTRKVSPARHADVVAKHSLGRLNTVDAVARFIVHLHHQLPHTSGQVFQLDSRIHPLS